jgi:hypothetical protein
VVKGIGGKNEQQGCRRQSQAGVTNGMSKRIKKKTKTLTDRLHPVRISYSGRLVVHYDLTVVLKERGQQQSVRDG